MVLDGYGMDSQVEHGISDGMPARSAACCCRSESLSCNGAKRMHDIRGCALLLLYRILCPERCPDREYPVLLTPNSLFS